MTKNNLPNTVAIIGAGAAGLMAAEVLSAHGVSVQVFEQMPTAGRKILMAGKTGLNISHDEPLADFITRYTPSQVIANFVRDFCADDIRAWMTGLGVDSFVGSSGRIFPKQMKASGLLRAWLDRLKNQGVAFFYRHCCVGVAGNQATFIKKDKNGNQIGRFSQEFSAIILACGGGSYARLGSDGAWQAWFGNDELTPLYASNVGVVRLWSPFMYEVFGQVLKRVSVRVGVDTAYGDVVISHYGMESGVIYKLNRAMRQMLDEQGVIGVVMDLLPDKSHDEIDKILTKSKKQSLNNSLRKAGLDNVKISLLRECTNKTDWSDLSKMTKLIKALSIQCQGFRPIDEAISTGGGVRLSTVNHQLQSLKNPYLFIAGEMLDWDAPTGGYLLTACLAMGRVVANNVANFIDNTPNKAKTLSNNTHCL